MNQELESSIDDFLATRNSEELTMIIRKSQRLLEECKEENIASAKDILAKMGLVPSDLLDRVIEKPVRKGVAQYRNPNDHNQTWTGKGKKPNWFKDCLEKGIAKDDMRIPQ
jgi:DNA-binding protein H-NS